ncbi:aminoacyl--tRNA ligase-related protein [Candidatus Gromoviella agglomerans]|uniref:aminoacyl--tRNA ligase-related protein n=1 Tax=Candidatus Gromoviella agglomerans TaxID=2806609 RepID=UPI001E2EC1A0|nr:proline--tRNA ligase [Candidatus Gromoviella agglomerans]UFX98350.1 Proline--tRNA ligase [Candidatus Gromoviella agglomerans]
MKLSQFFIKTKVDSSQSIYSHNIMIRSGMIYQLASGLYAWTPLGMIVLQKLQLLIRFYHDNHGCQEILIPTLQPSSLWERSGRINDYGLELLRIKDRGGNEFVYGPTAEEAVADLFHQYAFSYKSCPQVLYNIQWKFRDEIRPRHGVMRAREFLMSDAYSFDVDEESAMVNYEKMFGIFVSIFMVIGLPYVVVNADSGPIGGDFSHEFHLLSNNGESKVCFDKNYKEKIMNVHKFCMNDVNDGRFYSDEKMGTIHKADVSDLVECKSIEVGHNFYFGDKYTSSMKLYMQNATGRYHAKMGSYGIGISRLVAAIIEASHDDFGVRWPLCVAPFHVMIINFHNNDDEVREISTNMYISLLENGVDVAIDDRNISGSEKIADAYLIGCGYMVIFGKKEVQSGFAKVIARNVIQDFDQDVELPNLIEFLIQNLSLNFATSNV